MLSVTTRPSMGTTARYQKKRGSGRVGEFLREELASPES